MATTLPQHWFKASDGGLHDTRMVNWHSQPVRSNYCYTHRSIDNVGDLKATLRNGQYVWPGGYPLYFLTSDGGCLSFQSVLDNLTSVVWSIRNRCDDGWRVVHCDVNWESHIIDDHSGNVIESAYGDDIDDAIDLNTV